MLNISFKKKKGEKKKKKSTPIYERAQNPQLYKIQFKKLLKSYFKNIFVINNRVHKINLSIKLLIKIIEIVLFTGLTEAAIGGIGVEG